VGFDENDINFFCIMFQDVHPIACTIIHVATLAWLSLNFSILFFSLSFGLLLIISLVLFGAIPVVCQCFITIP